MEYAGILGYTGSLRNAVTGGYPLGNGYRMYLPGFMRFNSPDDFSPFGAGGVNCYAYCAGDPINQADPTGHIMDHPPEMRADEVGETLGRTDYIAKIRKMMTTAPTPAQPVILEEAPKIPKEYENILMTAAKNGQLKPGAEIGHESEIIIIWDVLIEYKGQTLSAEHPITKNITGTLGATQGRWNRTLRYYIKVSYKVENFAGFDIIFRDGLLMLSHVDLANTQRDYNVAFAAKGRKLGYSVKRDPKNNYNQVETDHPNQIDPLYLAEEPN